MKERETLKKRMENMTKMLKAAKRIGQEIREGREVKTTLSK